MSPRSRAMKDAIMSVPMMEKETPETMMKEARHAMMSADNSMMRGKVMMMGAKVMQGMMKKKKMNMDDSKYSDLGGMNFDPKKIKKMR